MITLLHGDYIEASRNELNRLKEKAKGRELRELDGRTVEESDLTQSLESSSLFGGETVVIIERLFSKIGRQQKRIEKLCTLLAGDWASDIILWEDKEVSSSVVKQLGSKAQVRLFKLPVLIFQFLDSVHSGSASLTLGIFEKLVADVAPELVFSMLVRRVRQLMQIHEGGNPAGLAGWQISRLTTQAKSFTMEQLVSFYRQLLDSEVAMKTGASAFTAREHIEYLLSSL